MPLSRLLARLVLVGAVTLPLRQAVAQQNLGHRILGTLGLDAGSQPSAGVSVDDRALLYASNSLRDRYGRELPVGLRMDVFSDALGVLFALRVPALATYVNGAIGVPLSTVRVNTTNPIASLDAFGLGDLYVQPLKLGWRLPHLDLGVGFAFYAPTGRYEPGGIGNVGQGQWTEEATTGGTVFFDRARTWQLSALASYDVNSRKLGVDITRGDTVQIQGGAGKLFLGLLNVGIVGYGLWQTTDNTGSALPPQLLGLRDQAWGLGPEVDVIIRVARLRITVRYTHDIEAKARPLGQLLVVGLTWRAWEPPQGSALR
jgi:hypothetical protein